MLVTTTFTFEGYKIKEYKGLVRGIIVRSPNMLQSISGGLKSIVGGKIGAYTNMCETTREQSYDALVKHAQEMNANAIVGFRYDATSVIKGATEVLAYGTAVVLEEIK